MAATGQYIWKFPKMPQKLLKVLANTLAIIKISSISLVGYSNTLICIAILLFPLNFGSLAVKTMAFFEISSLFIINPSLIMLRTNILPYVWSNTYNSTILPIFGFINNKSSGNCRYFIIRILHIVSICSHIQLVHIVWLIGIKTNGNYRNFIIFTCFICSIMCYIYSYTKTYTISPLVWLVGCKYRGHYRNFDNFPSIFCRLVKIVTPSL